MVPHSIFTQAPHPGTAFFQGAPVFLFNTNEPELHSAIISGGAEAVMQYHLDVGCQIVAK